MPFVQTLDALAQGGLTVRYRGSTERQKLTIDVIRSGRCQAPCLAAYNLRNSLNLGFAGGADFHPTTGFGEVLAESPDLQGPELHWEIDVAGLSPLALRNLIENHSSIYAPPQQMVIVGSLALDDSPLSVTEQKVVPWLDSFEAYPMAWPEPGFEIEEDTIPKGAFIRVDLDGLATSEVLEKFHWTVACWNGQTQKYPLSNRKKQRNKDIRQVSEDPQLGHTKSSLTASWQYLDIYFDPGRDLLINGLVWFHHKVAPIRRVHIGL